MLCDDSTPLGDQKQPGNDSWLQADYSPAALAGESPGSARSATMAWEFFGGQAVTAQGQDQRHQLQGHYQEPWKEHCQQYRWQQGQGHPEEPSAEIAAHVLNSVESWTSSASHAGLQHAASGGFTLQTQPGMYGFGFGHRVGTESSAAVVPGVSGVALLAGGHGQKRKAHQREVQQGQLDELDEATVDQILAGSLAPPFMFEACRTDNDGNGCGAAHAGGQHMQLGDLASMTEVQAMAQHLLHAAAAAETKQPKKSRGLAILLPLLGQFTGSQSLMQLMALRRALGYLQHVPQPKALLLQPPPFMQAKVTHPRAHPGVPLYAIHLRPLSDLMFMMHVSVRRPSQ